MSSKVKLASFVYPGCITVCNVGGKCVGGDYPEIARILKDRSVVWKCRKPTAQMREYVKSIVSQPHIGISYTQSEVNFFSTTI